MKMRSPRGAWSFDEPFTEYEVELCGEFIQFKLRSRAAAPETHVLPSARPGFSIESTLPINYEEESDAYGFKSKKDTAKTPSTREAQSKKPQSDKPKEKGSAAIQCSSKESGLVSNLMQAEGISAEKALQQVRAADKVPKKSTRSSSSSSSIPPPPNPPMLRLDTGDKIELINMEDYVEVEEYEHLRTEVATQDSKITLLEQEIRVRTSSHAQLERLHRKLEPQTTQGFNNAKESAEKHESRYAKVLGELVDAKKQTKMVRSELRRVNRRILEMETFVFARQFKTKS
jgi:hypothetical protein